MFPYRDENQTLRLPIVTIILIAINVLVWLVVQGAGMTNQLAASVCNFGLIPGELTQRVAAGVQFPMGNGLVCLTDPGPQFSHVITSMFLHGSWMHLLGNMWFLWLFGNNVEDSMTRPRFLAFYFICGIAAALAQVFANPSSAIPTVGASGAISGVMGAYLILYPTVRVHTLVFLGFFITTVALPAWVMLIYWIFIQFASGLLSTASPDKGGVAFWAHVGGFVAGIILVKLFARTDKIVARQSNLQPRPIG